MMRRFYVWGNGHPFLTISALWFAMLLLVVVGLQREADHRADEIAREATERAEQVAASALDTCKDAVLAVTSQGKSDDLAILAVIKARFAETGRPVPPIYLALEENVRGRVAPIGACEPDNPVGS